jgi:hypothetical protein
VKAFIVDPATGKLARVDDELDGQNRLHVDAVLDVANQQPIPVTFAAPGGAALPKMVTLNHNTSLGAVVATVYRRVYTYNVPLGFNGYLIRYTSFQNEVGQSRIVAELGMGTLSIVTNAFVIGLGYNYPQWSGLCQAEVTTGFTAGPGNVVVTATYTNELGVSGRTGTITIPVGSVLGSRWDMVYQTGDLGARSIQNLSVAPTLAAGAIKVLGFIQLGYHEDGGTVALETLYAPGATTFPEGTIMGIEFAGGTVSKTRRFDILVQLIAQV